MEWNFKFPLLRAMLPAWYPLFFPNVSFWGFFWPSPEIILGAECSTGEKRAKVLSPTSATIYFGESIYAPSASHTQRAPLCANRFSLWQSSCGRRCECVGTHLKLQVPSQTLCQLMSFGSKNWHALLRSPRRVIKTAVGRQVTACTAVHSRNP